MSTSLNDTALGGVIVRSVLIKVPCLDDATQLVLKGVWSGSAAVSFKELLYHYHTENGCPALHSILDSDKRPAPLLCLSPAQPAGKRLAVLLQSLAAALCQGTQ
jgi:hypothetical protein